MSEANSPERDFEKLSKAITEAVMTSSKVRKIVAEIQKKDEVCAQSFMVLVLRLSTLTENLEPDNQEETEIEADTLEETAEEKPKKKQVRKTKKKTENPSQFIDGEKLTPREQDFHEFINRDFDQDDWLKKNKLIF
ncbi:MAG: hypothetical protein G3M70_08690 [Candidatus Nitronauta litoralis]|uniref:Uncharacterized protein n=1 Tax=Candidatus Nitronauta litoralis TaxID=2705533 RepID=A0A7T0BVY2_9BACT|nr:MAG: hypothetical protein G3M70_08690 [Candidatus Nitronauta litoralis]